MFWLSIDGKPLASFQNLPGPDPDMTPAQMRNLAAALVKIADDCEAVPTKHKPRRIVLGYEL